MATAAAKAKTPENDSPADASAEDTIQVVANASAPPMESEIESAELLNS